MKAEIREHCRKVLRDNDIPTNYLPDVISNHYKKKKWLMEVLGLNEENMYRISIPLPSTFENRPLAYSILEELVRLFPEYRILDLSFIWQGKNKVKVTKVINMHGERLIKGLFTDNGNTDIKDEICEASCLSRSKSPEDNKKLLLIWYGGYIKNGRIGYISANPYDYLTLSGKPYCSYTSCLRLDGGEYNMTPFAFLSSSDTLVGFASEELCNYPKKIGRVLLYANRQMVISARGYGNIFESDSLIFRHILQDAINTHTKQDNKWVVKGKMHSEDFITNTYCYIDWGYGVHTEIKDLDHTSGKHRIFISEGKDNICPCCGDCLHEDSFYTETECANCGHRYHEDDLSYYDCLDMAVCHDCADELVTYCNKCNEYYVSEDICSYYDERGHEVYVCAYCLEKEAIRCYDCESFFASDIMHEDENGDTYCEDCFDKLAAKLALEVEREAEEEEEKEAEEEKKKEGNDNGTVNSTTAVEGYF